MIVGFGVFFDEVEKTPNPTAKLWHAAPCVFAVRKQHTIQVKPVEGPGAAPQRKKALASCAWAED
jgi:hypothetical protein